MSTSSYMRSILRSPVLLADAFAILLLFGLLAGNSSSLIAATPDNDAPHSSTVARPAWATAANDRGPLASDLPMQGLTLILKRPAPQQQAFEQYLREQQDRKSPNFHRWLTPTQVGQRFGLAQSSLDAMTNWMRSQGLHVDGVANGRTRIVFSGSAQRIDTAFGTQLHSYLVNGEQRIAPASALRIPAAIASLTQSVVGLVSIREHAAHGSGSGVATSFQTSARKPVTQKPAATFCSGSSCTHYIFPSDFATIYDINPAYQQGNDGSDQTIAVIGRARVYLPDIENFQLQSGLQVKDPVIIIPPNGGDPGAAQSTGGDPSEDQLEATIDVTRASSVAPGAQIDLIASSGIGTLNGLRVASVYAVDTDPIPVRRSWSISFGACEADAGQSRGHRLLRQSFQPGRSGRYFRIRHFGRLGRSRL